MIIQIRNDQEYHLLDNTKTILMTNWRKWELLPDGK